MKPRVGSHISSWSRRSAPALAIFIAIVLVGVTVGRVATPADDTTDLDRYNPLPLGMTQVYQQKTNGTPTGTHLAQVIASTLIATADGVAPAVVVRNDWSNYGGGGPFGDVEYYRTKDAQLLFLGDRIDRKAFSITSPSEPVAKLPIREGTGLTWSGTLNDQKTKASSSIVGMENVDALGKHLANCAHYHTESTAETGSDVIDSWFCPGYGLVRSTDTGTSTATGQKTLVEETLIGFASTGVRGSILSSAAKSLLGNLAATATTSSQSPEGATADLGPTRSNSVPGSLTGWHIQWTDVRAAAVDYAPVGDGSVEIIGEEDGNVSAMDTSTGEVSWRLKLEPPIVVSPVVSGGTAYIADGTKHLYALDIRTGAILWTSAFADVVTAPPLVADNEIVIPTDDRYLTALSTTDGKRLWTHQMGALAAGGPALGKDTAVISDVSGHVEAVALGDGSVAWSHDLQGSWTAGPAVDGNGVFLADDAGNVVSLDTADGHETWSRALGSYASVNIQPAIGGGRVVILYTTGDEKNWLEGLREEDGSRAWRARQNTDVNVPPVIVGDHAITLAENGTLSSYALDDGRPGTLFRLSPLQSGAQTFSDVPLGYVGGNLVATTRTLDKWGRTSYVALSTSNSHTITGGISFSGEIRSTPSVPRLPSALHGNDVVFPDTEGSTWRIPATGGPTQIAPPQSGISPVMSVAGDLVLTQSGNNLVARDIGSGEEAWTAPMGKPAVGVIPATKGKKVFVPRPGKGLSAVDLSSGDELWTTPLPTTPTTFNFSGPLPLGQGAVAYDAGGLRALDAGTGEVRWTLPNVENCSPLAKDGDTIIDLGEETSGAGGDFVMAVDASTGAVRWKVPFSFPCFSGAVAAHGVVIAVDDRAIAHAYDESTGRELWSLRLRTPVDGSPVLIGDKVVIAERGRYEDLSQRDYRVTVLDLKGRYLGSFEPTGTSAIFSPSFPGDFGVSGNTLLMPGSQQMTMLRLGENG